MKQADSKIVILAAGGTGGHIFPAVALAEVLRARGMHPHLITDRRFHQYTPKLSGVLAEIPIHTIHAGGFGGGWRSKVKNMLHLLIGVAEAWRLLHQLKPRAVVGFGGYPSFPTMLAAALRGERTMVQEQNAVLGRVNRLLARYLRQIALTYDPTRRLPQGAQQKTVQVGTPVRAGVLALAQMPYVAPESGGMLRLLVMGGSQGASVFAQVVPAAIALLPAGLRARIRLDQQCRAGEMEATREAYAALHMQVDLQPFFTDVAARLAAAHVVIGRAGASTMAELAVAGRPALLVPLPSAMDNHQYYNALAVAQQGAGWVVAQPDFTPEMLAKKLTEWLENPAALAASAMAMRSLARADAAEKLADLVVG